MEDFLFTLIDAPAGSTIKLPREAMTPQGRAHTWQMLALRGMELIGKGRTRRLHSVTLGDALNNSIGNKLGQAHRIIQNSRSTCY